jgi:predicted nucleic acid-binding protein
MDPRLRMELLAQERGTGSSQGRWNFSDEKSAVKRVYLETTIVSYLTSRPSRDLVIAARQEITREWWEEHRQRYELCISQFVLDEAGDGDPDVARRRLSLLSALPLLEITEQVVELGEKFLQEGILPRRAATDAFHIATATVHEMDVLLTWNCAHLANAELLGDIARTVRGFGYEPPVVCTPDELMGEPNPTGDLP